MSPNATIFEVRSDHGLLASCSKHATALLLARDWLREPAQSAGGTHTCLILRRDANAQIVEDQIVALSDGPLKP